MSKSRTWTFTINNYGPTQYDEIRALYPDSCKYIVCAKEFGESGTPHLQGYVVWKNAKTMSATKTALDSYRPTRPHVEVAKGNAQQNFDYCTKGAQSHEEWEEHGTEGPNYGRDVDFFVEGIRPQTPKEKGVGEKRRYEEAWDLAKQGKFDEIDADIRIRHYGTLKKICAEHQPMPQSMADLDFHWYQGPTRTGKSRTAREENPIYYVKNKNKWWDGFVDQPCVIIEEWNPQVCPILQQMLKEWCDHHPFHGETKGGSRLFRPKKIIVTSNYSMFDCFGHDMAGLYEPLMERFKVKHFYRMQ